MTNSIHDGSCIKKDHDIMTRVIKSGPNIMPPGMPNMAGPHGQNNQHMTA